MEDGRQVRTGRIIQIPEEWLNQQPISVVLNAVSGEVIVVTARDGRRIPTKAGMALFPGDRVLTGADSSATLRFVNDSTLLLQADTELEIRRSRRIGDRINDVEVNLEQGRVENDITPDPTGQPHYRIRNDIAVTAVHGTAFRLGLLESERLQTEVLRGSVSVANDSGASLLKQGNGVVTEAGQAPGQPIRLLEAPDLSTLAQQRRPRPVPGRRRSQERGPQGGGILRRASAARSLPSCCRKPTAYSPCAWPHASRRRSSLSRSLAKNPRSRRC
ncbi:MAG: FecR domain-containing protein [Candidatus Sedimenticola endophacoides]